MKQAVGLEATRWVAAVPAVAAACLALAACGSGNGSTEADGEDAVARADAGTDATADVADAADVPIGEILPDAARGETGETDGTVPGKVLRLHAEGTNLVDSAGKTVVLRGANLGGWMFHETWITHTEYPDHGRMHVAAVAEGIEKEVDEVLQEVGYEYGTEPASVAICPGNGPEWREKFFAALEAKLGKDAADAFKAKVEDVPGLCDDSDAPFRNLLAQRFGTDVRDTLQDAFQAGWITEKDVAWLASQGFNLVRVPIGYRALVTGEDKEKPEALAWNPPAFDRLHELLGWCETHGVYAVIDIQEAPGGQNTYAGTPAHLYSDPKMEALTVELWEKLSDEFKTSDAVAAYSLLAEPYGAPDTAERDRVYDVLVKALRARGDDHLAVIHDGFFGVQTLPVPSEYGWEGVVYSTHLFEWKVTDIGGYDLMLQIYEDNFSKSQAKQGVPYFIGSFSPLKDEDWAYEAAAKMVGWYEGHGWSWSLWTLKRFDDPITVELYGTSSAWGLLSLLQAPFDRPDLYLDDQETLAAKLSGYASLELLPNEKLLKALKTGWSQAR